MPGSAAIAGRERELAPSGCFAVQQCGRSGCAHQGCPRVRIQTSPAACSLTPAAGVDSVRISPYVTRSPRNCRDSHTRRDKHGRKFRPTLLAGALALALTAGTASAQFTNSYIFGDSLFDAGQYGSRFTTNPGLVSPMYVAQNWGITVTPSFTGGTDYAQGGALVNSPQGTLPPGVPDLSVAAQVSLFLSKGPIDPNALYQIDGGGNDIIKQFTLVATGQITAAQAQAAITQAALDLATQVGKLKAAGAQYLFVQAVPDIGKAPLAQLFGPTGPANFTALSGLFNSTLNAARGGRQVIQFNSYALLNEIIAQRDALRLRQREGPACKTPSSADSWGRRR